jgi:hypothetical protein
VTKSSRSTAQSKNDDTERQAGSPSKNGASQQSTRD